MVLLGYGLWMEAPDSLKTKGGISMKGAELQFGIPEKLKERTPLFQSILELIVMTLLPNLQSNTTISDATLIKRKGKHIYGTKRLRNYVFGVYERLQDVLLTVKRCGGLNYISRFKIINHNKRHLSKPKELAKMIETGEIRSGDWFIYDGGLKSGENAREARKAGVKVVTRLGINFVVHRFGKEIRK